MKVTKGQVAAFIEALCMTTTPDDENQGPSNSPAAYHHLQAILGGGNLPWAGMMLMSSKDMPNKGREKLAIFRDYLSAVAETITDHLNKIARDDAVAWTRD